MTNLLLTARLDVVESLRARWFLLYTVVFGGRGALQPPSLLPAAAADAAHVGVGGGHRAKLVAAGGFALWRVLPLCQGQVPQEPLALRVGGCGGVGGVFVVGGACRRLPAPPPTPPTPHTPSLTR